MRTSTIIKALLATTAAAPLLCQAESNYNTTGASPSTATAHVDFQITIPKFLFLRVGTGTGTSLVGSGWATNATIDKLTWAPTAAQVGTGVALAPTGGDALAGAAETAAVVANNGNVTLQSTTTGALSDGPAPADTISFTTITVTPAKLNSGTILQSPALADAATTTITLTAVGKIVQQDATWSYSYSNAAVPPAGTYGGVNVNNGRVVYTAQVP
jgi:hypothetical protein